MPNFELSGERAATIQLSDTFSDVYIPQGAPPIPDFDSVLTAKARNSDWQDFESPIGLWPETGSYGAVLLADLRAEQGRLLDVYREHGREHLPDAARIADSLDRTLVGVINWAPRGEEHHRSGQNGEDFYLARLEDNVLIFSQLPFLQGVATRGLVQSLYRVRDDNPVWPDGEQFRSSIVSHLRNFPEFIEERSLDVLPDPHPAPYHLAYGDKYGNARVEKREDVEPPEIERGKGLVLLVEGREVPVMGAERITDIPQDELGIYTNPADRAAPGPQYFELLRRVGNPNDPSRSAYEMLRRTVMGDSPQHPPRWSEVEIELAA